MFSSTQKLLPKTFSTKERGKINVKGKGEMTTFWVESKSSRPPPTKDEVRRKRWRKKNCLQRSFFVDDQLLSFL